MEHFNLIFWIFYGAYSLLHMWFCFRENEKARKISKCFIVPLLILYMAVNKSQNLFVYLGAFFGFLGDVLIIFKKKKPFFVAGAVAFMAGHVFYMMQMYKVMGGFIWWNLYIFAIIVLLLVIIAYNVLYQKIGKMIIVGVIYFSFLISTLFVAVSTRNQLIIAGTFTFVVSDVILAFVNFFKPTVRKKELYVMSTYILAQTLMILALM